MSENENKIRVVLRTRPTPQFASKQLSLDTQENMITINNPKNEDKGIINNQKETWTFKFDKILHNVSQEELFEFCAKEVIEKAVEGYNGTVFAYGQTGSGKTFTMSGTPNNYNYRGIIPRSITRVFQEIGNKPEYEFIVRVSYLEIYNEILSDLLPDEGRKDNNNNINIQEDNRGNLIIKGLSKHVVNNEEEAFNLLFEGENNRTISEHMLNKESTRSHCIFMIYLEMKSRIESSEKVITAKLNFVDLAGSERVKKTGSTGLTLIEANYINKSLTFLEQVVVSLTEKGIKKNKVGDHIPYRQSKLTHLLKDSIGGNCRTVMIATAWPEERHIAETLSTLNFAKRMMAVSNEASVNIQLDTNALLRKYVKEIKELKQELAMHNTLANRGRISYDPYTPEEQYSQQNITKKFLTGETEDIEFESVRQAKELFNQARILYQKVWNKKEMSDSVTDKLGNKMSTKNLNDNVTKNQFEDGVGELEMKPGFGIGKAQKDARPVNKLEISKENINLQNEQQLEEEVEKAKEEQKAAEEKFDTELLPEKNTAFIMFKTESSEAKEIEYSISSTTDDLKFKKHTAKELMEVCNQNKSKIDDIKILLNDKKLSKLNLGDELSNVIDEEECKLIQDLKDFKDIYKENFEKFKNAKSEIIMCKNTLEILKEKYVESFENWFHKKFGIKIDDYDNRVNKMKMGTVNLDEQNEKDNLEVDPEEQAYFNAKKKVESISKAKRMEKNRK